MLALFKIPKHCNKQQFIQKKRSYLWWSFFFVVVVFGIFFLFCFIVEKKSLFQMFCCLFYNILTNSFAFVSFEPFAPLFHILISEIFYGVKYTKFNTRTQARGKKVENFETMAQILTATTTTTTIITKATKIQLCECAPKKNEKKNDHILTRTRVKE